MYNSALLPRYWATPHCPMPSQTMLHLPTLAAAWKTETLLPLASSHIYAGHDISMVPNIPLFALVTRAVKINPMLSTPSIFLKEKLRVNYHPKYSILYFIVRKYINCKVIQYQKENLKLLKILMMVMLWSGSLQSYFLYTWVFLVPVSYFVKSFNKNKHHKWHLAKKR